MTLTRTLEYVAAVEMPKTSSRQVQFERLKTTIRDTDVIGFYLLMTRDQVSVRAAAHAATCVDVNCPISPARSSNGGPRSIWMPTTPPGSKRY